MKKKHELSRIADIFSILLQSVGPLDLVDFGAGQGHLSRLLALRHNVKTFRVEQNEKFLERSAQFDQELREKADFPQPVQIHKKVEIENQGDRCLNNISGPHIAECYAGLHLCGDFSAAIVQDFVRNPKAKALISLGCCYMKLNGGTDRLFFDDYDSNEVKLANNSAVRGYPLSDFVKSVYFSIMAVQLYRYFNFRSLENHQVSYTAREAACHNLHQFEERLKVESDPGHKSHCYRALLEHLIVRQHPACRHLGVRGVKLSEDMTFRSYVDTVKSRLPPAVQADLSEKYLDEMSQEIDMYLSRWDRVIKFYSLRLMLAPVVESILLLDRLIFLKESGLRALLIPIFDSRISPRNLVLLSVKK